MAPVPPLAERLESIRRAYDPDGLIVANYSS